MDSRRDLPDDIEALKAALIAESARATRVEAELAVARAKASVDQALIAHQQLQIKKLTRELHGSRSERTSRLLDQIELQFEELESASTEDRSPPRWRGEDHDGGAPPQRVMRRPTVAVGKSVTSNKIYLGKLSERDLVPRGVTNESDAAMPESPLSHVSLRMYLETPNYSALTDCTVQFVGTLPTPPVEAIVVPFMNHIAVLPLLSRHKRSLMPSPL